MRADSTQDSKAYNASYPLHNGSASVEADEMLPTRIRLQPCIPLRFPNFEKHYELGTADAFAFEMIDCRDWYHEMVSRILNSIQMKHYVPIYRMGDGEYSFALGARPQNKRPLWKTSPRYILERLKSQFHGRVDYHKSGSVEYGFEEYTDIERQRILDHFIKCLRKVAGSGFLALGLHNRPIYEAYIPAILDWFDANGVILNRTNYYHVYAIYALMHGPDRFQLLRDRRVLVVTSLTDEKRVGIETGLRRVGVSDVQFIPISSTKSLFDTLDLNTVTMPIDVALVGAGVGAVSILAQLEPLQTACIDVGFALSTLASPELRWNRPFCVPDEEFSPKHMRF